MKKFGLIAAVLVVAAGIFMVMHQVSPLSWGLWGTTQTSDGLALEGYDPVAYFMSGEPTPGDPSLSHEWRDATWRFANEANRAAFIEDPDKYSPQYGAFCAYAVSKGFTAKASPDAWHIADGKLYVFADTNVRQSFVDEISAGIQQKSNNNWAKR